MSDTEQPYNPSERFTNVATLYGNHFKFVIDALPDLTFFAQSATLPSISSGVAPRPTPFTAIPEVGDHLQFNTFQVGYLIDNAFKTYFSLFYWLRGYGFPTSYDEVVAFQQSRAARSSNPRPSLREIQKTNATLTVLQPDNDSSIVEIRYQDVFPTGLGEMQFETTDSDAPLLKTLATFYYTDFQVALTNP